MAQATYREPPAAIGSQSCPSDEQLRAVAEGSLPEPELDTILRHLTSCDRCEASLARFAEEQTRAEEYRVPPAAESALREPECLRMQAALRDLAERIASNHSQPDEESTDKSRLSTDDGQPKQAAATLDATTTFVPTIPRKIGRYEVRSLLGEGAYGQVLLAHDPQLDRQVAIKVARYGPVISGALIEVFLREAKVAAKLKHPGIVAVYDAGVDEQAGCYIVMEYVEGRSLKQEIAAGKVPHEKAAHYIAQAAEALAYAHQRDLVHRDIKPANLLLDKEGKIKVADFGLAIFEEEQRKRAGEIAGTIAYCSPEQIRGDVHHLDGRTDIWSLGVVLYELLTGRRPFGGPNITNEILHRPPKPPRQIDHTISKQVEQVCFKCLIREPAGRFETAMDLANRLQKNCAFGAARSRRGLFLAGACATVLVLGILALAAAKLPVRRTPSLSNVISPDVVAWEPYDIHDTFGYDNQQGCFRFDAFGRALFSAASPTKRQIDARVSFSIRRWKGRAGIFWDLRHQPDGTLRCWCVSAGRYREDLPFMVEICSFVVGPIGGGQQGVVSSSGWLPIKCDPPRADRVELRVVGNEAHVEQIWLNGRALLSNEFSLPNPLPEGRGAAGFFGHAGEISVFDFVVD